MFGIIDVYNVMFWIELCIIEIFLSYIEVLIYVRLYLLKNSDSSILNKVVVFNYGLGYL